MRSVRLFDFIEYDGGSWQVMAQDGTTIALKSLATNRIRKIPLPDLLGDESYLPDNPDRLPSLDNVAVIETLDAETRTRVEFLHRHVVEVLTGVPPNDGTTIVKPRPEYDPTNRLADRIEAKLNELRQAGTPIGERSLKRYLSAYRRNGLAGLIDRRRTRQRTVAGRTDQRIIALLETAIAGQTDLSTGTRDRVINQVRIEATKQEIPLPSRATMYRALSALERNRHPFGNATTRRTQANRPARSWGRQAPSRPGELVEIDSTPLDLMVVNPDGSTGRVDLTMALDIATRTALAAILRPVATKAVDAAVLLARALTPIPMQPGWAASLAFSRSILPQGMIDGDDAVKARIAAKPVIVPDSITIDRGKVFVGSTFLSACERLQISIIKAAPRTPTDKPHIERAFAAINSGFTQYLAGYVGPNVVRRGTDPGVDAQWTLAEVQNLLDLWIVSVWQNRPHSGLRHPAMPRKELTPNEAYAALSGIAPAVNVALTTDDYIGLLPIDWRSIQPYGVNFAGLHYDSSGLHEYRGVSSGLPEPARGRWEIRFDPYRMNEIFIRDHKRGRWIHAEWTMAKQALAPFSLDVLNAARSAAAKRGSGGAGVDVLAEINRIQTGGAVSTRERTAARRNASTIPVVPEPDPTPSAECGPIETAAPIKPSRQIKAARRIDEE
ncbi:Mu transposase C-terminal domain-containing protein [Mycobacterium noviomagense]|uniref:Integrase n=1 Tax=Mycobacterium noviomagense TaxID=459858 RepID=A0A7I7PJY5_9MYCO|nr:Mu transposase C-terminal domain-containing protein [Mycobacterium noviomagense]ORB16269.1 integrase [Mycobacterium noviomagense]BBY08938.1 transposase [Mycobacterium noviomagense]